MPTGTVKWFNNAKGFGFILPEEGGEDLFVHYSAITMEGYKTLKAGQPVEFDAQQGTKGFHAVNVRSTDPPPAGPTRDEAERLREDARRLAHADADG